MHGRDNTIRARTRLPFRAVNRRGSKLYDPALQRHHLLPCQALSQACFEPMFDHLRITRATFDDFRSNGLLLPAREEAVHRLALPLHRGPHRGYNAMTIERIGQIERHWSHTRQRDAQRAGDAARMRLGLLQKALRRRLLSQRQPYRLNRKDPLGSGYDFSDLDAMAEELWRAT